MNKPGSIAQAVFGAVHYSTFEDVQRAHKLIRPVLEQYGFRDTLWWMSLAYIGGVAAGKRQERARRRGKPLDR